MLEVMGEMAISEKEMKLLMNLVKDDVFEPSGRITACLNILVSS